MTPNRYFDYAASAPLDYRARAAMDEVAAMPGNASSLHAPGRALRAVIDRSRADVAGLFGATPRDVSFTSGATEANVTAVLGVLRSVRRAHPSRPLRVLSSAIEHASVAEALAVAARDLGVTVELLPTDEYGRVSPREVADRIGDDVVLVAVMWANNVLGTLQPIAEIGAIVADCRADRPAAALPLVFMSDAVQAVGTQPVFPFRAKVDILTASAHKLGGPKGVGALVMHEGVPFEPLVVGGGQEGGRRHGTENVAAIAGFGAVAAFLTVERAAEAARQAGLRASFEEGIRARVPRAETVGGPGVPGITFLRFGGMNGDELALRLDASGFAVSAGSACDSGKRKPPRALVAAVGEQTALKGGIRVSFGRGTTEDDVVALVAALSRV